MALDHAWGMADVDRDLLLESITHTGAYKGTDGTVTGGVAPGDLRLRDRAGEPVDKLGDDIGPYIKYRLGTVYDESGGQLDVNYSDPSAPPTSRRRRRPTPNGASRSTGCHRTVPRTPSSTGSTSTSSAQVTQTDRTGYAPDMVTTYDYQGGGAWHYDDDDGLTKEKYKTWSQWRGYQRSVNRMAGATTR